MALVALIISFLNLMGGILLYYRHDKKIKEQEVRLNELRIKELKKQEQLESQAKMCCNLLCDGKGNCKIRFFNAGKVNARNVRVVIKDEDKIKGVFYDSRWGPYDLITPQGYREERIVLGSDHTPTLHFLIIWDDDFAKNREIEQNPQFS